MNLGCSTDIFTRVRIRVLNNFSDTTLSVFFDIVYLLLSPFVTRSHS